MYPSDVPDGAMPYPPLNESASPRGHLPAGVPPAQEMSVPGPAAPGGFLVARPDRLTPGEVRGTNFARAGRGRRGLDEDEVHAFLDRVEAELVRLGNEKAALAEEVQSLRERLSAGGARGGMPPEEAHFQAVRILSQAQQTADLYVADAERYTRELAHEARLHREAILSDARGRAELMMEEAHQRADRLAEEAARQSALSHPQPAAPVPAQPDGGDRLAAEREIAYLRTYSDVYRTHLRSYLEALLRNVDEWEKSEQNALPARHQPPAR
ncbi:DivIVA domain-containing protein [Actinomadura macrotermitis]|uniref:DivIVA domain-containing protein n=1 Tax=Actinomadura macrotermitis TaxID=2585200 RepID=UPI001297128C|nr:DivIVA domain-containing protein [Actinomadura macrotermitis]